jgi:hypothetical protein
MSAGRKTLARAASATIVAGFACAAAGPGAALAATTPVTAFATIGGSEPLYDHVRLDDNTSWNSATNGYAMRRGYVDHNATGFYNVVFEKLTPMDGTNQLVDPGGVVQVRTSGLQEGTCHATGVNGYTADGTLGLGVECFDLAGKRADRRFTIGYTRGGTAKGTLITARLKSTPPLDGSKAGVPSETSIDGAAPIKDIVAVRRTNFGQYTFSLYDPSAAAPDGVVVTPTSITKPGIVCGVNGTSHSGTITEVKVKCRGPLDTGGVDTPLHLTFARGTNPLGEQYLSSANASVPLLTSSPSTTTLGAGSAQNLIYGVAGGTTVSRLSQGYYEVRLDHQNWRVGGEYAAVTADATTDTCRVTGTYRPAGKDYESLYVRCVDASQTNADTAFRLSYAAQQ